MKRYSLLLLLIIISGIGSFAQKMTGYGVELSVLSFKPTVRDWFSKSMGLEVFGGIASEIDDLKANDFEVGIKYLNAIIYKRDQRTYVGIVGKWKWIDAFETRKRTSLPVPGILIGKEWYAKRVHRKSFAVELGYQFGAKDYPIYSPINHLPIGKERFEEFPLILNLRYSFYTLRK